MIAIHISKQNDLKKLKCVSCPIGLIGFPDSPFRSGKIKKS